MADLKAAGTIHVDREEFYVTFPRDCCSGYMPHSLVGYH